MTLTTAGTAKVKPGYMGVLKQTECARLTINGAVKRGSVRLQKYNKMKIGSSVVDQDGTHGIITEIRDGWARYKCRPYASLPNLLTHNKDFARIRKFWAPVKWLKEG